ncbi:hypothetical protein KASHIRA_00630 [Serratia phage vB_SmaM-Kashira]|nr:hypothetical protein KASHIRA_00630 [Serratia phage vB_SmaM-Kashira]
MAIDQTVQKRYAEGQFRGVVTAHTIVDLKTGAQIEVASLVGGGGTPGPKGDKGDTGPAGPAGPKGDKGDTGTAGAAGRGIKTITANNASGTVTLTFNMSDNTTETATFTL